MIIKWTKSNVLTIHVKDKKEIKVIQLLPSVNEIDEKTWKLALEHPVVKKYVDRADLIEVRGEAEKGVKVKNTLKDYVIADAIPIIRETYDRDLLKKWKDEDKRAGIDTAIDDQLDLIKQKTTLKKEDD